MATNEDFYAILEVHPFAPVEKIRESYRRLALRCHPDKNRDVRATEDFQRVGWVFPDPFLLFVEFFFLPNEIIILIFGIEIEELGRR